MTIRVFVDRSRIETYMECPRRRYLQYHEGGMGIVAARTPLPLVVGGATHSGQAVLLWKTQQAIWADGRSPDDWFSDGRTYAIRRQIEDDAVAAALAEFSLRAGLGLALDANEEAGLVAPRPDVLVNELEASMGMPLTVPSPSEVEGRRSAFDAYLAQEQRALVEAIIRAYSRRRLRPLLEEFEVLEVEREGEWLLWENRHCEPAENNRDVVSIPDVESWFMSRPDALLLSRADRQLYLLSFKTASGLDVRRRRDAERDMQGLSEGIEIERRLAEWWAIVQDHERQFRETRKPTTTYHDSRLTDAMWKYLRDAPAPPRILAVRYEFLLKGERWSDKDLAAQIGVPEARSQRSHLIRAYEAVSTPARGVAAYAVGDLCWSWDYTHVEDTRDSKLAWQNWKSRPVWERDGGVRAWIDKLGATAPLMSGEDATVGMEPRTLGWRSDAQALGVTREHPLDAVFPPAITIYRNDDDLRDLIESIEWQERQVAEHVAEVNAAADEGERRSLLNRYFAMNRGSCSFPSECSYVKVCYGGEDIRRDPLASGLFVAREPNHPQEKGGDDGRS